MGYAASPTPWVAATPENRYLNTPEWACDYPNYLGVLPISRNHFITQVTLNGVLVKGILDTGGTQSMVNTATAKLIGLQVEVASEDHHFVHF